MKIKAYRNVYTFSSKGIYLLPKTYIPFLKTMRTVQANGAYRFKKAEQRFAAVVKDITVLKVFMAARGYKKIKEI